MEIYGRHWSPDDLESYNGYEIKKQRMKKRKTNQDDRAEYLINKSRKKGVEVCKNCNEIKSRNVCAYANEFNPFDYVSTNEKFVWGRKIECDVVEEGFSSTRPTNMETKMMYSVEEQRREQRERMEDIEIAKRWKKEREIEGAKLKELVARKRARAEFYLKEIKARADIRLREDRIKPIDVLSMHPDEPYLVFEFLEVKDMEDLREDIKVYLDLDRATPSRIRYWEALLVVCDWELAKARKKEALHRARVRGEISTAEFLDEERGLHSSTEADVRFFLEGNSYSEIEVLQSEIESHMRFGSANLVEYWEPVLMHIQIYKAKAFLKEEFRARTLHMNLDKDHRSIRRQEVDSGYDGKNDQKETEGAEGTGSSSSPELLYGEETGDNFEMKTMGVVEEGDALSENIDEAILRSPVYCPVPWQQVPQQRTGVMQEGDALSGNIDEAILRSPIYCPVAWQVPQQGTGVMQEGDALSGNIDEAILRSPVYCPAWQVPQGMGVMEEGNALSGNIDEAILRSPVYCPVAWQVPQQGMGVMEEGNLLSGNIDEAILRSPVYCPVAWQVPQQGMGAFC